MRRHVFRLLVSAVLTFTAPVVSAAAQVIRLHDHTVSMNERGGTYSQSVWLLGAPTSDVRVEVTSGDPTVVTVAPTTLTFTPANYGDKQQVTYQAVDDRVANDPLRKTEITFTASGGGYDGVATTATAQLADNEAAHYVLDEGYTYRWPHRWIVGHGCVPAVLSFSSSDPNLLTVDPPTLTWTGDDSGTTKYVYFTVRENLRFGDGQVTVTRTMHDPPCSPLDVANLVLTLRDNDHGLRLIAHGTLREGGPDMPVTVQMSNPAPAGGTDVTVVVDPETTATRGSDFTLSAERLRIPEGQREVQFMIHTMDDTVDDDDEMIYLFAHCEALELDSNGIGLPIVDDDGGGGGPAPGPPAPDPGPAPERDPAPDPEPDPEPATAPELHIAPYWRGGGGFAVRPADGRSALVRLQCGQSNYESREFAGDDGLIVRLVELSQCFGSDGERRHGELTFEGIDDDGWYWINGDYNAALAPLVRESSLRPSLRPPIPDGVSASPSGDQRFVLSVTGRLHGTLVEHEANGFIGIIPHLVDLEGAGRHAAPFWRGHGGVVGKPLDGVSATFRLTCADGRSSTHELEPHPDGFIAHLIDGCFDAAGEPIDGQLEADGLEDGAWYWLNHGRLFTGQVNPAKRPCRPGRCSAAAPLVRRDPDSDSLTRPVVPGGVTADQGPLGSLFIQGKRFGIVTSWEPVQ